VLVVLCVAATAGVMAAVAGLAQPRQIAFMMPGQKPAPAPLAWLRF
jgi:hypothetical protein